jgi:hypothetical protein
MSDENFINRWSRRKREAADESVQSKKTDPAQTINPPGEEPELSSRLPAEPSANAFDVSSLPSIESISAGTDITAFLQAGVPSALRRAALRRAWEADPAIRDFVGLNENYWNDVAGAAAAPGFGDLDPSVDVKRMVSELFGDSTPEQAETEAPPASPASADTSERSAVQTGEAHLVRGPEPSTAEVHPQSAEAPTTEIAAVHNQRDEPSERSAGRRHGSALPE